MNNKKKYLPLLFALTCFTASADNTPSPMTNPWGLAYLHGWMTDDNIGPLLVMNDVHLKYGQIDTIELLKKLAPVNGPYKLMNVLGSSLEGGGNMTRRNDPNGLIYEFDAYLMLRWQHFPWDRYVTNTFAFGDGLSYVTKVPAREISDSSNDNPKHLLNFLTVEATFAMPSHPELQMVTRIHHRCGAWGLFGAGNLSSNALSLGVRYWF